MPSHKFVKRVPPRPFVLSLAVVVLWAWVGAAAVPAKKKPKSPEDLFNPMLGVEYSHWLQGPIFEIATAQEVEDFLLITSDDEAQAFVDRFWDSRDPKGSGVDFFAKKPRQIFDERSVEADKRFSEGAYPGRRTDRGSVLIVYGEPEDIEFEAPRRVGDPTLEVWKYPKDSEKGLDGEKPKKQYRFVRIGEKTVRYTGQPLRRDPRDRLRPRN
ncbi:MAG: GWxTD domain-containing protein [Acidobacteriota bacterium]